MNDQPVSRDERTVVVENASYHIAYLVMSFGLLASVAYRSFVLQQSSWDLLALVILGGATATVYQGTNRTLSRRWIMATVATFVIAGLLAIVFVIFFR
jgi:1,4-dihydroxy-2-naphthoate octaprenyltransferase